MNTIIIYIIEVIIASGILSGFYYLFLKNLTFFRLNRFYILAAMILPFFLPLINISTHTFQTITQFEVVLDEIVVSAQAKQVEMTNASTMNVPLFQTLFFMVTGLLLLNVIIGLMRIWYILYQSKREDFMGNVVFVSSDNVSPFSVFNRIVINQETFDNKVDLRRVIIHEQAHIHQKHGLDVFIAELITVVAWSNPFVWLLKKELKSTHEYLADQKVLEQDVDLAGYFMLIFNTVVGKNVGLANHFNQSLNFKRMKMMKKKRSARFTKSVYLMALPVFVLIVMLFSEGTTTAKVINDVSENFISEVPELSSEVIAPVVPEDTTVFLVVDKMPCYPGGDNALMEYLKHNVKYPAVAQEHGIQGRVYVKFIVETDGKISNIEVSKDGTNFNTKNEVSIVAKSNGNPPKDFKGDENPLVVEAIRIVKAMPNWEPGMQRGEPVRVSYRLPINFALK